MFWTNDFVKCFFHHQHSTDDDHDTDIDTLKGNPAYATNIGTTTLQDNPAYATSTGSTTLQDNPAYASIVSLNDDDYI